MVCRCRPLSFEHLSGTDDEYPIWEKFIGEMQTNIQRQGQTR